MTRPTYARTCHVKGSSIATRVKWVQLNHGQDGIDALRSRAGDELAELLESEIELATWYPLERFIELNVAIDEQYGTGDLAMVKELGRYAAEANLTTVFRMFFKVGTVQWILARAARIWGMHYDSGQLLVREFPDEEVELEIVDFGVPSRVHCLSVQGWAEGAARLTGVKDVVLDEVDCRAKGDARCRFRLNWDRG